VVGRLPGPTWRAYLHEHAFETRLGGGSASRDVRPEFVSCFAFGEVRGGVAVGCFHYIGDVGLMT